MLKILQQMTSHFEMFNLFQIHDSSNDRNENHLVEDERIERVNLPPLIFVRINYL